MNKNVLNTEAKDKTRLAYDFIRKKGYNVLVVALYGSQNYGLDSEKSDCDFKAIVLPELKDLIQVKDMNATFDFCGGKIEVKSVYEMFKCLKKQAFNFVEILFTDYYVVNPIYFKQWEEIRSMANEFAYADPKRTMLSFNGTAHITALKPKQIAKAFQMFYMFVAFTTDTDYNNVLFLKKEERDFIKAIKNLPEDNVGELNWYYKRTLELREVMKYIVNEIIETDPSVVNTKVYDRVWTILEDISKKAVALELCTLDLINKNNTLSDYLH